MISFFLSRPYHPIRELLVTTKVCVPLLPPLRYSDGLVIAFVHRHHSLIELLVASLPWKLAWLMKANLQEGGFQVRFSSDLLSLAYEEHGIFSKRDLASNPGKGNSNSVYCFEILLIDWPWLTTQKGASHVCYWGICWTISGSFSFLGGGRWFFPLLLCRVQGSNSGHQAKQALYPLWVIS